jgi:hypothetical protein
VERVEGGCKWGGEEEGGAAAIIGERERGSARVREERGAPIHRIKINGLNSLSHLSSRPSGKKCQKIYCFPEECLLTPNPNAIEHERKEKKKFNFFSENWGITPTRQRIRMTLVVM